MRSTPDAYLLIDYGRRDEMSWTTPLHAAFRHDNQGNTVERLLKLGFERRSSRPPTGEIVRVPIVPPSRWCWCSIMDLSTPASVPLRP